MQSLSKIKTIPGFVEPLNVTFLPDGSKAYVGNYGAHWVGVIDVRRHELIKKIQVAAVPGMSSSIPTSTSARSTASTSPCRPTTASISTPRTATWAWSASSTRGRTRSIKHIRVGKDPWRIYMSHDGKYGITPNNGDETISIIDTKSNRWRRRSKPVRT